VPKTLTEGDAASGPDAAWPVLQCRGVRVAWAELITVAALAACGYSKIPRPAYVGQPSSSLVEVRYPPPPARVEIVPDPPREGAVWIDGEWTWRGQRWAWKRGRWVMPPPDAAFAPWTSVRNGDGTLYWAEGQWRDRNGKEVPAPTVLALAHASPGEIVNAEGEQVPTGRNILPEGVDGGAHRSTPPVATDVPEAGAGGGAGGPAGEREGDASP